MEKIEKTLELGGRTLTLSTGLIAPQTDCTVIAQYGETVVMVTVVGAPLTQDMGYFPLSVEYQERLYAGGRIKGSRWVKREGKPTDEEVLKGRLIDRSIRPLFPVDYKKDVQVTITVLSVDMENDPLFVAPIAVSAAVAASPLAWDGPVSTLAVGKKDKEFLLNPTEAQKADSDMDLIVSATKDAIVMIEAGSNEVPEEDILGGIEYAFKASTEVLKFINDFAAEVGSTKEKVSKHTVDSTLEKSVKKLIGDKLTKLIPDMAGKKGGWEAFNELKNAVSDGVSNEQKVQAGEIIEKMLKSEIRAMILKGKRPDGRAHTEIRKLYSEVGLLPRTHGSAIFQRGLTQALNITTLGAPSLGQLIETAEGEEEKRYIHHYSMPPYSSGETGRMGYPNRREIGHGALAERALIPVIPSQKEFPYAIRVVSEITSSNGSTSMAATCSSTLSLMDAGVPISSPVSGIAMGLVIEDEKNYAVLSDIAGIEDFNGDMDFKVTGTEKGVTALQLDVKTLSLTLEILKKAIAQAKEGRMEILKHMLETIKAPRSQVSKWAPKIKTVQIKPEKIGEIIGPGGKMIKKIIAESGAEVEVDDSGFVNISGINEESVDKAVKMVENLVKEVLPGEIYTGTVKRIQNFGAFVEVLPGKEGLVHISDMSEGFVSSPEDLVSEGKEVQVRVKEIDSMGRLNLSMVLDPSYDARKENGKEEKRNSRPTNQRREFRRGGRPSRSSSQSGPHFPASRFVSENKKRFSR